MIRIRSIATAFIALGLGALVSSASAQAIRREPRPVVRAASMRPIVIVGGWSNCPAHFTNTQLVRDLRAQRGAERVLLTTHADPFGDIDANAIAEGRQIAKFMDGLRAAGHLTQLDSEFDLVGFSMGGLIVRSLVLKHADVLGRNSVANLVTMATPNHGANPMLTHVDPGFSIGFGQDVCTGRTGPLVYNGSTASRQMAPDSTFLSDLNGRALPPAVRVHTIAGEMQADVVTTPAQTPQVIDSQCNSNCTGVGPAIPVRPGFQLPFGAGTLEYDDQWHGECEAHKNGSGTGQCKSVTVCGVDYEKFQDGGVWKCRQRITAPSTPRIERVGLGSDGFIRVSSVRLRPNEAATIVAQHVLAGMYHTQGTEDQVRQAPNPKPLVDARGVDPMSPGRPAFGTPIDHSWFFEDARVTAILRGLVQP